MAKKSFREDIAPAMRFISQPEQERGTQKETASRAKEPPTKLNPLYIETKSRRVQLLMQPSLHAKIKDQAAKSGKSFNDYIHYVLENHIESEE
jgi:predicted HicB family RNase H-like nuclease